MFPPGAAMMSARCDIFAGVSPTGVCSHQHIKEQKSQSDWKKRNVFKIFWFLVSLKRPGSVAKAVLQVQKGLED